jgi:hypothetical protein
VELMIVYGAAMAHYGLGTPVRASPISRYLEMPREPCVATWVDWCHSVCLNAQRSSGRCDYFARELRDYCEYRLACPIVLDTRKNANREASTARSRGRASRFVERPKSGRSAYWTHDLQKARVWGFKISLDCQTSS